MTIYNRESNLLHDFKRPAKTRKTRKKSLRIVKLTESGNEKAQKHGNVQRREPDIKTRCSNEENNHTQ